MYKFRVKLPGKPWSRWADWSTTSLAELEAESKKRGATRRARQRVKHSEDAYGAAAT